MLRRFEILLVWLSGFCSLVGRTQTVLTPDAIVQDYIRAIGGSDRIDSTRSLDIHGVISLMGRDAPMHEILVNQKGFLNDMEFNGIRIEQCITDTGGWELNPAAGHAKPVAMSKDAWSLEKGSLDIGGPLHDYARKGSVVTLQGLVPLHHSEAYELRLLDQNGISSTYFIDTATHYLVRNVIARLVRGISNDITIDFYDYSKLSNGLIWPMKTVTELPQGFRMVATDSTVTVNTFLPGDIFSMPRP